MTALIARLLRTADGAAGCILLAAVVALALTAPLLFPGDPLAMAARPLLAPFTDAAHPLGTDRLGRDVAAGLAHAAGPTLVIAFATAGAALLGGTIFGTIAGLAGGRGDEALMRVTEAFQTVPGFVLALALIAVIGPSRLGIVTAAVASAWPAPARLVRAEVQSVAGREFVLAARALGAHPARLAVRHVLPHALPPVITLAAVVAAGAVLIEAALAFLGLADADRPSWGAMIAEGRAVLRTAPWLAAIPGTALVVTVLGINLVGDGIIRAMRPPGRTG